jgi:hypothetical protein
MRVAILTWEYPPRIVGKLAEYVSGIATDLVNNNVETNIITYHDTMTGTSEEPNGAIVTRVSNPVHTHINTITWALTLNQEVERAVANIHYTLGRNIDLIDVHDWHFVPAAVTLKHALEIPFIFSIDSLEDHRAPGVSTPFNMAIKGVEWLGFYESQKITAKSDWMQNEIFNLYKVPKEKIKVIYQHKNSRNKTLLSIYKPAKTGGLKQE